jgi:hypothetical protein
MKTLILSLLVLFCQQVYSQQYQVEDIDELNEKIYGTLSSKEIVIINKTNKTQSLQCSLDKQTWTSKQIKKDSGIDIYLTSDVGFFYIKICGNVANAFECKIFRFSPGLRYVMPFNAGIKEAFKKLE